MPPQGATRHDRARATPPLRRWVRPRDRRQFVRSDPFQPSDTAEKHFARENSGQTFCPAGAGPIREEGCRPPSTADIPVIAAVAGGLFR